MKECDPPEPAIAVEDCAEGFSRQRILVVGDLMLDWFIWGSVSRISPEAPVPVVEVREESRYPGGAANVARNMTPFGAKVELAGLLGRDPNGELLRETLAQAGIGVSCCLDRDDYPTITKTRVVAQHQQVVRIDREKRHPMDDAVAEVLAERIAESLDAFDGLIVEDYGKGLITPRLVEPLLRAAADHGLPVTVDPKPGNPIEWRGVHTVKPNRPEAFAAAGIEDLHRGENLPPLEDAPLLEAGRVLLDRWQCRHVLLTLGEQGMLVFSEKAEPVPIAARAREVYDVSGAGDTAIALYTLAICAGLEPVTAAQISNAASSLVVGKLGTAPVERDELFEALGKPNT